MIFIFTVLSSLCAAPTAGRENISRSRLSAARRDYCELPQTLLHPNKRLFQILIPSDEFGLGSIYSLWRKTMKQKCVANVNFIWILIGKLLILKQWQNNRFVGWSNKGEGVNFRTRNLTLFPNIQIATYIHLRGSPDPLVRLHHIMFSKQTNVWLVSFL